MKMQKINVKQWIISGLIGLTIFSAIGCQRSDIPAKRNRTVNGDSANSNTTVSSNVNESDSMPTTANTTAPNSGSSKLEQKANAIVGKWETTTALDDKIAFDFGPSKKEGETYVGTYTFYVNDTQDPPAKYIVSGDKMIKFFNDEGREYRLIKVSISDNGKSLSYDDQKGGSSKLTKVGSQANKKTDSTRKEKSDCTVIADNADYFVSATEKTIKLKKGTLINVVSWEMHQGLYAVKAQINGKWVRGEINSELTSCI